MANPTGIGGFKPGQSGNPEGMKPMPPELKAIKALSPQRVKLIISKLAQMHPKEMMAQVKMTMMPDTEPQPGDLNNIEMMIASVISRALTDGDASKLNFLLDRCIGKVVEQKILTLQPVRYVTTVRADGVLLQDVVNEALDGEEVEAEVVPDVVQESEPSDGASE